jgi:hypothetical protein
MNFTILGKKYSLNYHLQSMLKANIISVIVQQQGRTVSCGKDVTLGHHVTDNDRRTNKKLIKGHKHMH